MFVLVRHAHAGHKGSWPEADAERPLTPKGREEANGLVLTISALPVKRVLTSPYRRCRETLFPLCAVLGVEAVDCDDLRPDASTEAALALLSAEDRDETVYCTHGEWLDRVIRSWRSESTVALEHRVSSAKGSAWVVEHYPGENATGRYIATTREALPVSVATLWQENDSAFFRKWAAAHGDP